MSNTGIVYQQNIIPGLASTYFTIDESNRLIPDFPVYPENCYAAGTMYSTAQDLLKFSNALFYKKFLTQDSLDQMFVSGLDEYGFGVWVYENYDITGRKYKIVKRPGRIMGAQSMLFHILEDNSTIVILSNTGNMSLDEFAASTAPKVVKR